MVEHWYYFIFLAPLVATNLVMVLTFRDILFRHRKTILGTTLFFSLWYFLVDILAVRVWHIWFYDTHKIIGVWLFGTTLEEWIWMMLVAFLFASLTIVIKTLLEKNRN